MDFPPKARRLYGQALQAPVLNIVVHSTSTNQIARCNHDAVSTNHMRVGLALIQSDHHMHLSHIIFIVVLSQSRL